VPRLLTDDQKENCVEINQELLAKANGNENFLKNIITGDEMWVYGYDDETKMQSSQWMGKGSPQPKKSTDESVKDWKEIVHHEFVPRGQMVHKQLYWEVLACLGDAVRRKRPDVGKPDLVVAPQQCTGSHIAPNLQLSGKTSDIRYAPYTLFSRLSPSRLFPVS